MSLVALAMMHCRTGGAQAGGPAATIAAIAALSPCAAAEAQTEAAIRAMPDEVRDREQREHFVRAVRSATLCTRTRDGGAWATAFEALDASERTGRFALWHIAPGGAVQSLVPARTQEVGVGGDEPTQSSTDAEDRDNFAANDSWGTIRPARIATFDYDGDGTEEAVLLVASQLHEGPSFTRGRVWTVRNRAIALYERARDFVAIDVVDYDGDGRPDLRTHGPWARLTSDAHTDAPVQLVGPPLIAHAVEHGAFTLETAAAERAVREACPAPPDRVARRVERTPAVLSTRDTAVAVACARLWGASPEPLALELERACAEARTQAAARAPGAQECDPVDWRAWAAITPPVELRNARQNDGAGEGAAGAPSSAAAPTPPAGAYRATDALRSSISAMSRAEERRARSFAYTLAPSFHTPFSACARPTYLSRPVDIERALDEANLDAAARDRARAWGLRRENTVYELEIRCEGNASFREHVWMVGSTVVLSRDGVSLRLERAATAATRGRAAPPRRH